MKLICIMPARGGSTRIPEKNIIDFHGKPIMSWPLQVLVKSPLVDEVFVSSESKEILEVASQLGAQTISRPADLSDNFIGIVPVVQHAIYNLRETISDEDLVLCVFPTNVWLTDSRIQEAIELAMSNKSSFLVGVARLPQPPARTLVGPLSKLSMPDEQGIKLRTQDSEPAYYDAGFLYLARATDWNSTQSVFDSTVTGMELSDPESIDIDNQSDLEFARLVFENYKK